MADEPVSDHPYDPDEEEGGPIKSFLEHLEDLRWVLIKSIAAAGVAMIVCFFAGNYVFKVLVWPLKRAPIASPLTGQTVRVMLGTNQLGVFTPGTNDVLRSLAGTNQHVRINLVPVTVGTNQLLALAAEAEDKPPPQNDLPIDI